MKTICKSFELKMKKNKKNILKKFMLWFVLIIETIYI